MKLSFILLTYRRPDLLYEALDSILAQRDLPRPYEIIVVDNDGQLELSRQMPPGVELCVEHADQNLGVTGGRNLGMSRARGECWVFLDDDARWQDETTVARMLALLDMNTDCAAVGIRSLVPDGSTRIAELPYPDKTYAQALTQPTDAPYFIGFAHALRAEAVHRVGLYPERYFYSMEELDLSLRLIDAGYLILYDPNCAAYHLRSDAGREIVGASYWQRNALNKIQVGWRLLPLPYPLTTALIWSVALLWYSRDWRALFSLWRQVWDLRTTLQAERQPIHRRTIAYLRRIGARLAY